MLCFNLEDGCTEVLLLLRKMVLNGGTQAPHPFGMTVFENHVFFTDWTKMGVIRANRFNGSNPSLIYRTAKRPGHVVVSHSLLQPVGKETYFQSMNYYEILTGASAVMKLLLFCSDEPLWQTQRWL